MASVVTGHGGPALRAPTTAAVGSAAVVASADVPVRIVDRVTLPRTEAQRWVDRMHRVYRPSAEARGLVLDGVWQTRADADAAEDAVAVVVEWRLPGVREFFRARAGAHDPATVRWWADTDALALARTRSVLGPLP